MSKLRVCIYDDDSEFADKTARAAKKGLTRTGLDTDIDVIAHDDVENWLKPKFEGDGRPSTRSDPFAGADIVIIDMDLRRARVQTAEKLAYWLRCYSTCTGILALNPRPKRAFDLTLQTNPHAFSWTDLGVYQEDLESALFWRPDANKSGYRPWYWPDFGDFPERVQRTVEEAGRGLAKTIEEFFRIPDEVAERFPRRMLGSYVTSLETTLDGVAEARIHREDRSTTSQEGRARVAAATLRWWLGSVVLPPQDVLIDAPHLLTRFPSLIGQPRDRLGTANRIGLPGRETTPKMRNIKGARFQREAWLPRPAWWFGHVIGGRAIEEMRDPGLYRPLEWVFAEDTSRFHAEAKCEAYTLAVPTPLARRHVRRPKDAPQPYEPVSFLLAG